jgi:GDPmannose 4,6-dehydratase
LEGILKVLITGITGQDGSYLAELLLSKGYEVHGIVRRVATEFSEYRFSRINHILKYINIHSATLENYGSIYKVIAEVMPDELYHLAAQSYVGYSFDDELSTMNININGTHYILNCLRELKPNCKFFFAGSSEMFGKAEEIPQKETTPFHPRSSYGIAKVAGFDLTRLYREAYDMYCCSGITFNHESILKNSPIAIKTKDNQIDILPIEDLFKSINHRYEGIKEKYKDTCVWDGEGWTKILSGSFYKDNSKKVRGIQTVSGIVETTLDHIILDENKNEVENKNLIVGDCLFQSVYPEQSNILSGMGEGFATFLGYIAGDGYISDEGSIRLIGTDLEQLKYIANILVNMIGCSYRISYVEHGGYENCTNTVYNIDINNASSFGRWLKPLLYTEFSQEKRVPKFILNSSTNIKEAFFKGYYMADGRKAGHETYEYKGFTSKSATLTLGLIYLLKSFSNQIPKVKLELKGSHRYYYTQLTSPYNSNLGKHLLKNKNEIIKVIDNTEHDGQFFDIQTESGFFATGANLIKIHNSPRRGSEFVTRKISLAVSNICKGKQTNLRLGNLEAKRDWGYAEDFVEAFWLMLQQSKPKDYVIGTGETHTVQEFVETAFNVVNKSWLDYVIIDKSLFRKAEVDLLWSDPSLIAKELGWKPKILFKDLVTKMVEGDLKNAGL